MKLIPKARPVQINKLKLRGFEINTLDDLKKHFYVNDLILLGNKFVLWLDRNEDTHEYATLVQNNLKKQKENEACALSFIEIFFNCHATSIINGIEDFKRAGINEQALASIVACIEPSESLAQKMLTNNKYQNEPWLKPWLEKCSEILNLTADFQYSLADALKEYNIDLAKKLIKSARNRGCKKERIYQLEKDKDNLTVKIALNSITLKKVKCKNGDFFITYNVIPSWLHKEFHTNLEGGNRKNRRCVPEFEDLLKQLNQNTEFIWDFPSTDEWTQAYNTKAIVKEDSSDKEWCKNGNLWWWIVSPNNKTKANSPYNDYLLHAVIRIKDNPKLQ